VRLKTSSVFFFGGSLSIFEYKTLDVIIYLPIRLVVI
jgi:hypothetical protein